MVVPPLGMHLVPGNNVRGILATILYPKGMADEDSSLVIVS